MIDAKETQRFAHGSDGASGDCGVAPARGRDDQVALHDLSTTYINPARAEQQPVGIATTHPLVASTSP